MKSRLYLPKLEFPPPTILEYLVAHFPIVTAEVWHQRVKEGRVLCDDGTTLKPETRYRHGITVLYSREVPEEPATETVETILYQDANILIADKPHGMVVTPAGDQVERALLVRLQKLTGIATLAPMHRLDRETAGVVLFALQAEARSHYHELFSSRLVEREYLAVAHLNHETEQKSWHVENRLEAGDPWYRRRISEDSGGEPNAITHIELLESSRDLGLFRLRPETGKKHQLRVHMASIGCPIEGDLLYPEIRKQKEDDPPLQLLAYRLSFRDPLSGEQQSLTSAQKLLWSVE